MTIELTVLEDIGARLDAAGIPYMLTGSMALAYYATPRMTRDIDIVVALAPDDVNRLRRVLGEDYYLDADTALEAVRTGRLFNLMHMTSAIKIDMIVRKASAYRQAEFERRLRVRYGTIETWVVTREDLILSKLEWSRESGSEMQRRDVRQLLAGPLDWAYLDRWAKALGVESALSALRP